MFTEIINTVNITAATFLFSFFKYHGNSMKNGADFYPLIQLPSPSMANSVTLVTETVKSQYFSCETYVLPQSDFNQTCICSTSNITASEGRTPSCGNTDRQPFFFNFANAPKHDVRRRRDKRERQFILCFCWIKGPVVLYLVPTFRR